MIVVVIFLGGRERRRMHMPAVARPARERRLLFVMTFVEVRVSVVIRMSLVIRVIGVGLVIVILHLAQIVFVNVLHHPEH